MAEPDGFSEFVDVHSRDLLRAAWWLTGDWTAAEDLVQTALAAAWPRWESITTSPDALLGQTVYTTNPAELTCRDPDTGQVRASAAIPDSLSQSFDSFAEIDDQVFALWDPAAGQVYLVRLTPPAACR